MHPVTWTRSRRPVWRCLEFGTRSRSGRSQEKRASLPEHQRLASGHVSGELIGASDPPSAPKCGKKSARRWDAGLPSQYGQGLAPRNANLIASLETSLCHLGYSGAWFFGPTLPRKRPPRVVPLLAVLDVPVLDLHYGGVLALVERPAIDRIFLAALLLLQDRRPMRPVFHRVQRH